MKIGEIDRTFLAKDVYRSWQGAIRTAKTDITIFSPYFDKTLLTLLRANTTIARGQVTIVTNISPENALEMPYQLRAAKQALSAGISVRSLDGLHAKVLLIDQNKACIGSQNFTRRGRRNKETTVFPATRLDDSTFVKTLQEWRIAAREVSEEEIEELLSELAPLFQKHKKLHDDIGSKCAEVLVRHAKKSQPMRKHLSELESNSRIRLAQRHIYARLKEWNDHQSLSVMNDNDDLTNWVANQPDVTCKPYELARLYMYPVFLADSNRMGFARISNRRITYVRHTVDMPNSWLMEGTFFNVAITFPTDDTVKSNILVTIGHDYVGECKLSLAFDGRTIQIPERNFSKREFASSAACDLFDRNIFDTLLNSANALESFLARFLQPFRYDRLGIDDKNADTLFQQGWYKVRAMEIHGAPLLVFERVNDNR